MVLGARTSNLLEEGDHDGHDQFRAVLRPEDVAPGVLDLPRVLHGRRSHSQ